LVAWLLAAAMELARKVKEVLDSLPSAKGKGCGQGEGIVEADSRSDVLERVVALAEEQATERQLSCAKVLETSLRTILCEYLSSKEGAEGEGRDEECWKRVSVLLDSTLWLLDREKVALNAFMLLLEDLAEEASLTLCEKLFQYIETKQPSVLAVSKNRLYLLKTCNKLLKRLSREDNSLLCGRLLILVAKLLPLSERSGVNLVGGFDVDNKTDFVELEEGCTDESGRLVDADLYNSLWRVQGLLSNPPLVLEGRHWSEFHAGLKRVVQAFDKTSMKQKMEKQDLSASSYDVQSLKYSTSPNLLKLQLHDSSFKCEYLFQVLVVLNHLKIELPVKKPPTTKDEKALRQTQLELLPTLEAMVRKSLKKFTPGVTVDLLKTFIQREKHWILWKKVGRKEQVRASPPAEDKPANGEVTKVVKCPPFEKAALPGDLQMFKDPHESKPVAKPAPAKRKRASMMGFSKNKVQLGNEALDRLWNISSDNYECLDFEDQEKVPRMRDLVQRIVDQAQEDSGVEEADKLMCDKLYCWRMKRLLSQGTSKGFTNHCDKDLEHLLPEVFPELREKIPVKEKVPEDKAQEEEEEEVPTTNEVEMKDSGGEQAQEEEEEEGEVVEEEEEGEVVEEEEAGEVVEEEGS